MSIFYFNLDLSPIQNLERLAAEAQQSLAKAGAALSMSSHAHILEMTHKDLHTRRQMYEDNLSIQQVNADTWVINLNSKARWIEDGMQPHEMIDDLLKSPKAKTSKDGSKFISIPFEHKKGPTQATPAQYDLTATIKSFLRNQNKQNPDNKIPYGKIEKNPDGSPKLGMLHRFDILTSPIKTQEGPFQGRGPIGSVRQGWTGTPFLQGLRIYQRMVKDKSGAEHVQRSIVTFRTVSSKQKGSGKWHHPGLEPCHFFEKTVEWAQKQWDEVIVPQILDELIAKI